MTVYSLKPGDTLDVSGLVGPQGPVGPTGALPYSLAPPPSGDPTGVTDRVNLQAAFIAANAGGKLLVIGAYKIDIPLNLGTGNNQGPG